MAFASQLSAQTTDSVKASRLTVGGYGEAVLKYNFFSDNPKRYLYPGVSTLTTNRESQSIGHCCSEFSDMAKKIFLPYRKKCVFLHFEL